MTANLDHFALSTGLVGGLALFLFGMDIMTRALKRAAGDTLKTMLARLTSNRFAGLATGAAVTTIIQSSSITTVLLVGFISAGLMSTAQSIAVILGANIGTTITAQVLAFKVGKIALPMLAAGFFVSFVARREEWRQYGRIVLGLGLVFFGMTLMSEAMKPLRDFRPFLDFMTSLDNVLLAAAMGAVFTALIQSSSATTGILIVMAGQGLVGLEAAIALALGANIGTCITAGLASLGKPREAVRTALAHILFNIAGVLIWIGLVGELTQFVRLVSPAHDSLSGLARVAAEVPRQIANAHTLFNVVNAALFIGFTTQITRLVEWLVPDRPLTKDDELKTQFINDQLLGTPSIALDAARRETVRLGALVHAMLEAVVPAAISGSRLDLDRLNAMDRPVDHLHREIIGYLRKVGLENLTTDQSDLLVALIGIANDLEHVGDQMATSIVASSRKRLDENVRISRPTAALIADLGHKVAEALERTVLALDQESSDLARKVCAMKQDLARMVGQIALHEIERLRADEPKRLMTYAREIELIETLDDIFKITRRIAKTLVVIHAREATVETSNEGETIARSDTG